MMLLSQQAKGCMCIDPHIATNTVYDLASSRLPLPVATSGSTKQQQQQQQEQQRHADQGAASHPA
jgi:hypothetical protein